MNPLIVIPARGGSKGVPRKNIKLLGSKPLVQYTVESARELFPDNLICLSTDDIQIKEAVESIGLNVPFIRPKELSSDTASSYDVLLHAVTFYENKKNYHPDVVVLLQPTSPFRTAEHIRQAISLYDDSCEMVVSVKETKANPYYTLREEDENGFLKKSKPSNFTRRQDCPKVYELNGAIYVIALSSLKEKPLNKFQKVRKYVMDEISSHDIDTKLDWEIASFIINRGMWINE